MKNVYKIFALLLVLIMSISMFVACNDNTTNTNTPTTPPDTTQEEQTGDLSDILGGTNVVPEGDRMQIPPTSGTYSSNALISLGTYSTYTFVGNEYEFKYYKFGALQPDKCHSGTFALANEKLVLTVTVTDPDTGITNVVETKSFDYGRYADGRLLIGNNIFQKMDTTNTETTE